MKVGFGAYRISEESSSHKAALEKALELGCSLIDTSANYTDGSSERLIGDALRTSSKKPLVITKAGYIQGENLEHFEKLQKEFGGIEYVDYAKGLLHSIDPIFLKDQIERSLERLGLDSVDALLLHNPEYFLKKNPGRFDEYYSRIEKAFAYLNEEVEKGRIKAFGISSNSFISPREDDEATDLEKVYEAAQKASASSAFKYIQFPMNMIEMDALHKQYGGKNLIERAKELGLTTIGNRPLNAFSSSGLLRLAHYPLGAEVLKQLAEPDLAFEQATKALYEKWDELKEDEGDKLEDIPLFMQLKSIWHQQASQDAVEQIFYGHFFPFIARIYGRDLSPDESQPYYELFELGLKSARKNMNERASKFMEQAQASGLIEAGEGSISQRVLKKYEQTGIDYVLVGMRKLDYVEDMKEFF